MTIKPRTLSREDVGFKGQMAAALHGSPKPCHSTPWTSSAATGSWSNCIIIGFRAVRACLKYGVNPWSCWKSRWSGPAGDPLGSPKEPLSLQDCWLVSEKRVLLDAEPLESTSAEYSMTKGMSLSFRDNTSVATFQYMSELRALGISSLSSRSIRERLCAITSSVYVRISEHSRGLIGLMISFVSVSRYLLAATSRVISGLKKRKRWAWENIWTDANNIQAARDNTSHGRL